METGAGVRSVRPHVILLGGPNGAGKTTAAGVLLPRVISVPQFVNADSIAHGLSGFDPDSSAIPAGRLMLTRLRDLARARESFAFETTLSSRSFATMLSSLKKEGYGVHIVYLWLDHPDLAAARVAERVRRGGHSVPDDVIRRRYHGGLSNFFDLYMPLADSWRLYDNSGERPLLVACRLESDEEPVVARDDLWARLREEAKRP
ncbi:MAG: AAA family ATPase [Candidatus Wallbacteria bacterium]|nr:AAA family ATPase [Candidatus Wallbacteria bacterium]